MSIAEEEISVLREEIRTKPFFLIKDILGYRDTVKFHEELIDFIVKRNYKNKVIELLILIPRGHFKTSVITVGLAIWFLLNNRNIRININNKILGNAKKFLKEIKDHFEKNQDILDIYGKSIGDLWQQDQIEIAGRKEIAKESSIMVGAIGHEITGSHFDIIINDDLVGLRDMVSEAERLNTLNFYKACKFLVDKSKGTLIINIGTRWHLDDLYSHLKDKLPKKNIMRRQALLSNGQPFFKQLYSRKELLAMKEDDLIMFSSQMQNEPIPTETQLYKYEDLNWFSMDDKNKMVGGMSIDALNLVNYSDYAMAKKSKNDYVASVSLAYDNDAIYVIDAFVERMNPDAVKQKTKEMVIENYDIWDIGAESNSFQELYLTEVENFIGRTIKKIKHSKDKNLRINGMHPVVIKKVYFRDDWESAYPRLIEQLIRFPDSKHDDAPDALEGALSMILKDNKLQSWDKGEPKKKDMKPLDILRARRSKRFQQASQKKSG